MTTSPLLTPEQETKLAEALATAHLLEQQSREMSECAAEIADKYYKCRHEAAIAAQENVS